MVDIGKGIGTAAVWGALSHLPAYSILMGCWMLSEQYAWL